MQPSSDLSVFGRHYALFSGWASWRLERPGPARFDVLRPFLAPGGREVACLLGGLPRGNGCREDGWELCDCASGLGFTDGKNVH